MVLPNPLGMDAVDVAVLRWLMAGLGRFPARAEIRESMSSASKKLGVPESTVRTKVKKLFG